MNEKQIKFDKRLDEEKIIISQYFVYLSRRIN